MRPQVCVELVLNERNHMSKDKAAVPKNTIVEHRRSMRQVVEEIVEVVQLISRIVSRSTEDIPQEWVQPRAV